MYWSCDINPTLAQNTQRSEVLRSFSFAASLSTDEA